jgi:hypothetical protein
MNGTSQHLTLEELTGDTELSPGARAHLATCAVCAAEASDWAAVASGIRLVVAGFRPRPGLPDRVLVELDGGSRRVSRILPYAAAAVLALSAGGYGLASALSGSGHQALAQRASLLATGCPQVMLAAGTLTAVTGNDLTLTPSSGGSVTVVTSQNATFTRLAAGTVSDIADGDSALVSGTLAGSPRTGGTLTATSVSVMFPGPSVITSEGGPGTDVATGTVTGVTSSGFTLQQRDGARFTVVISASAAVVVEEHISLTQLQIGQYTTAAGSAGSDGTLVADAVSQQDVPQSVWSKIQPTAPKAPAGTPGLNIATPGAPGSGGQVPGQVPGGQTQAGSCQPGTLTMDYLVHDAS